MLLFWVTMNQKIVIEVNMRIRNIANFFLVAFGALALFNICFAYTIVNQSSFYLHAKDSAGCPDVAPGQIASTDISWCGYLACATKDYDPNNGCLEQSSDHSGLTEGGYATWFSISGASHLCSVPEGNTYQCSWDASSGDLNFNYLPVVQKYSWGTEVDQVVELPKTIASYSSGPALRGINVSGLEYDGTFLDAIFQHPDIPDVKYFAQQGMNTIRLPIRWEFLLSTNNNLVESHDPISADLNPMYIQAISDTVQKYLAGGLTVILDLHSYMRFCGAGAAIGQANEPTDPVNNHCQVVTKDQLAYIWGVLAKNFQSLAKQYPKQLIFELMNEPYSMDGQSGQELTSADLVSSEVAAVKAIRSYGLNNLILLSGNYWDPLHGWTKDSPAPTDAFNGVEFSEKNLTAAGIDDFSNIAIDMHQYFDSNYSGTHSECNQYNSYDDFKQKLNLESSAGDDLLGDWLKANHMKVFLGEFGAADNEICRQDLNYMMEYVNDHAYDPNHPENGGFLGWTAWRTNRHNGFSPFNFLQAGDYTVYAGQGSADASPAGTGIAVGPGNGLMSDLFANYLTPASNS